MSEREKRRDLGAEREAAERVTRTRALADYLYENGDASEALDSAHAASRAEREYERATRCTSSDPTNHQGETCPVHEA